MAADRHKKEKAFVVVLLLCLGAVAVAFARELHRGSRLQQAFPAVQVGASEDEVRQLMGKPSWIIPCSKSPYNPAPHCTEYGYRDSFAPVIPAYYTVRFGDDGHVLSKYLYVSP